MATVAVFGVVVKGLVDAIRRRWVQVDGLVAQIVAVVVGAAIAWLFDVRATAALLEGAGAGVGRIPAAGFDYLITGGAAAFAAGFFAELSGKSGSTS